MEYLSSYHPFSCSVDFNRPYHITFLPSVGLEIEYPCSFFRPLLLSPCSFQSRHPSSETPTKYSDDSTEATQVNASQRKSTEVNGSQRKSKQSTSRLHRSTDCKVGKNKHWRIKSTRVNQSQRESTGVKDGRSGVTLRLKLLLKP